jgi:hypothetical protein
MDRLEGLWPRRALRAFRTSFISDADVKWGDSTRDMKRKSGKRIRNMKWRIRGNLRQNGLSSIREMKGIGSGFGCRPRGPSAAYCFFNISAQFDGYQVE